MKKPYLRVGCLALSGLMALSAVPANAVGAVAAQVKPAVYGMAMTQTQPWTANKLYQTGDYVTYQGKTYSCRQGHYSLAGWMPNIVPALWLETADQKPELPEIIQVSSVALSAAKLDLKAGETASLTAKVLPANATDKSLTWTTSNAKVATVANGTVTAKDAGRAVITVKAGSKTATCVVNVTKENKPVVVPVSSVTLSASQLKLESGKTASLTASVLPANATDKSVTWTSSNTKVASVVDGVVTAKKTGRAVITVKAGTKTDTCVVEVFKENKPVVVPVSGVNLSADRLKLDQGKTASLTASVLPANATDKSVTWTTSNAKVATVVNGVVTAKSAGQAVITAKAGDKTASCVVEVVKENKPVVVPVSNVALSASQLEMEPGSSASLTASVLPANATDKNVTWTSSNAKVAAVVNGLVSAKAEGSAVITAEAGGKQSTCVVTVKKKAAPEVDQKQPPEPFWKDYKNYPGQGTKVYYKGHIYSNKWYANAGFTPDKGLPWVDEGPAAWTVKEDPKNYQKEEGTAANSINKVLTDAEVEQLYGKLNPDYSPAAAMNRLDDLIPESDYNALFPYRFGSPAWKSVPDTKYHYQNPDQCPDYYSYDNLKTAVSTLSNLIIKVQWYEGSPWCYRVIRFDKTTHEQQLVYSNKDFDAEWIQNRPLVTKICDYGSFLAVGDLNNRKRELAGFLANISHETGGGNVEGIFTEMESGLYYNEEVGFIGSSAIGYVDANKEFPEWMPVAGKSYHGRGPIQLSYNYNYGLCSSVLYGDCNIMLQDPDMLEKDGVLGFMTGIWFWMTPQPPKPSCHEVITGAWNPEPGTPNAEYNGNFGLTIIIINNEQGQSENGTTGAVRRRAKFYRTYAAKMGADITGEHCDTVGMTTFTQQPQ